MKYIVVYEDNGEIGAMTTEAESEEKAVANVLNIIGTNAIITGTKNLWGDKQ